MTWSSTLDAHQHAGRHQPARQLDVVRARLRIARGMIVEHHDRRRAADHRLAEYFARLDDAGVERADREHRACAARGAWCRAARTPNCSTRRVPNCGSRYSATTRGLRHLRARRRRPGPACDGRVPPPRASAPPGPGRCRRRGRGRRTPRAPGRRRRRAPRERCWRDRARSRAAGR